MREGEGEEIRSQEAKVIGAHHRSEIKEQAGGGGVLRADHGEAVRHV